MSISYDDLRIDARPGTRLLDVSFRLANRTAETWRAGEEACLGWQLFDPASGLFFAEGDWRSLGVDIAPGGSVLVRLEIEVPPEPGEYDIYVSPRNASGWFYEAGRPFLLIHARSSSGGALRAEGRVTTRGRLRLQTVPAKFRDALRLPWLAIFRHAGLIRSMARRDLLARYRGSLAGVAWTVLHPLLLMFTYCFVFGIVLQARFGGDPSRLGFVLYFLAGMLPWLPFSEAVGRAPVVVLEHRVLVKKLVFPVQILPVNIVVASLATFVFAVLVFLGLLLFARGSVPATILWLPVLLVPQILFTLGLCWFLAATGVYLRDLGQIIGFLLTLVFFMAPICYPEASLPAAAVPLLSKSPIYVLVRGYRAILLEGAAPLLKPTLALWIGAWLVFTGGFGWFHKLHRSFPDSL